MKSILVIGLGRFGRHICMKLNKLNHQIMAIDLSEERVNNILSYVTNAQIGDATNYDFLSCLGIENFDACIVAIGDDFQNSLETTSLLKDLGAKKVIARAATGVQEKFLLRNGADEVVYPEKQLAIWTAIRCSSDHILDYIQLDEQHSIFEIIIPELWQSKTIGELNIRQKYNINILGIRQKEKWNMNITPETIMQPNQSILVLGTHETIQKCFNI